MKRSERSSRGSAFACSGDMYSIVPSMAPVWVTPPPSIVRASPKSISATRPCWSRMMLLGFRSRWMTPSAWAAASPAQACRMMSSASAAGNFPRWASRLRRSRPSMYSMVMNLIPLDSCTSKMRTTFLWAICRASSNSCLKRCSRSGFAARSGRITFSAITRSISRS